MSEFRKQHQEGVATKAQLAALEAADVKQVAKLFATAEGKEVLSLLFRRFGVLGRRVRAAGDTDLIVGQRDGEAAVVLFILQCMKASGETTFEIPL